MEFTEISEEEFGKFASTHELRSYLQTPEMAHSKQQDGWGYYYVGIKKNNKLICATLLLEYQGKFYKTFTSPRGYLIDFRDKELLQFFTKEIKKFIKKKKGAFLNIEPKILYKQRDMNGEIVENGFDNSDIYDNLINLGYKHNGFYLDLDPRKQVRWAYVIDLEGKTEDELFKDFKPNTRNIIRKAMKYGITTRELEYEELAIFKDLVTSSGELKNFKSAPLSYYQKMYNLFHPLQQIKFLVAEIHIPTYISVLNDEIQDYQSKMANLKDNAESKRKEYETQINNLSKKIEEAKEKFSQDKEKMILAGGMFINYGTEIVYVFSGTSSYYRNFQAQYLVQWDMIRFAVKNNYKVYNFYGISGNFSKEDKRHGLYEFKKSFGGHVIEYIGDFDLVVDPIKYKLRQVLKKLGRR